MRLITATLTFVLTLSSCEQALTISSVTREYADNGYRLYSEAQVRKGVGKFNCVASASGQCHYAVYERDCAADGCDLVSPRVFTVAVGNKLERSGMPDHPQVCVDAARTPAADCAK